LTTSADKLHELLDQFSGADHVLILINADPDAIASAMAFERLLWKRVTRINISNINTITRPDNMAMIQLFDVTLIHVSKIEPRLYNKIVILDSQPGHNDSFAGLDYTAIIDHHEPGDYKAPFMDIRPHYGATSSIMTEYLKSAKIKPSERLATALFHGIKTDTANFERMASNSDIRAFQFLFRHANIHLARRIEQVDLRISFLEYFRKAIEEKIMEETRIYIHLGNVENPDVLVLLADFFMRVNTVTWSIVAGLYEDRLIIIIRNDGLQKDAGKLAGRLFGATGSAGGHKSMARAEITLEKLRFHTKNLEKKTVREWVYQTINTALAKPGKTAGK